MTSTIIKPTNKTSESIPNNFSEIAHLSPLQRAYFIGQNPDFDIHVHPHLYLEFELENLDAQALKHALNNLLARHCMLRASVSPTGQISVVETIPDSEIPEQDLRHLNKEETASHLEQIRERLYRADLKTDSPPNINIEITRLSERALVHINLDLLFLDGTSVRTVLHELSQIYANPEQILPQKTFDLYHYEVYRQQKQTSDRYQRTKEYWFKRLQTLSRGPILPVKSSPPEPRRSQLVRRKHVLSASQWKIITKRAKKQEINPTTLLLTAFSLIVAYWSKYQRFSLTMMVQNREREFGDLSGVVGNFASTVLVEIDCSKPQPFEQQALDVHHQVFRDVARSMVCGLDVLQERNRQDGSSFYAASPVAFVSMLNDSDEKVLPGIFQLEGEKVVFCGLETPQVLLDHQAISRPDGGVSLIWDAMDSVFEDGVVEDMFNAYVSLISSLIKDERAWKQSNFDFRSEKQQICHQEYNAVQAPLLKQCLHEYLYQQVEQLSDRPLIIDPRRTFSYKEAATLSNRIAWTLRKKYKVKPNELIAVYVSKGWEQVIAAQAIIAAGAAYVPIDPNFPENRKLNIFERCSCQLVLTSSSYINDSCLSGIEKIAIDRTTDLVAECSNLPRAQSPEDLAYVIFTSGSTGQPKGVKLDNLGPINTIEDINRRFQIDSEDVILGISELSFDLSVYDIFGCIAAGATLVLPPPGANREPAICAQLCEKHKVTIWNSVPALAQLMAEYLETNSSTLNLPIRLFMMSGDWIPIQLPERLKGLFSAQIVSLGGATEGSIWSIYYNIEQIDPDWKSIPYGYPLTNQEFYVFDGKMQPRPDNVPGELYIGGVGVAQGYWKDPEKTAHSFVKDPISKERIYRTGDWGVRRPSGYIEFLGREDGQVKLRGYRIELGEIESVLQKHPSVVNAAVKVIGDRPQDSYLAAYIIAQDKNQHEWQKLQTYTANFLPEYMVPTRFVFLEQFPLGATGKVNRKALPVPSVFKQPETSEPPCTKTEQQLASLWSEILDIETPTRENNFFDLGGNSFGAVRLTAAISDIFGVELPVTTLLQHPTLEKLAELIDLKNYSSSEDSWSHVIPIAGQEPSPKTFFFHPSGGGILCYSILGQLLSKQLQLFGIQAQSANPDNLIHSIPEMVDVYLREIIAVQPAGPYRLGGWSMGGVIAYSVAQNLILQGFEVESLILIDSPAPLSRNTCGFEQLVNWFISDLAESSRPLDLSCLQGRKSQDLFLEALCEAQQQGLIKSGNIENLRSLFNVFKANINALHQYQALPMTQNIPCLVVMATQNIQERVASESLEIWRSLLPKTTSFHELVGNHYSLLKQPTVSKLARLIQEHFVNTGTL
ncbi:MAG: amino acid adenylation domain-containing protein [Moorea sp. SIOASIH]|uniref:non-ribosomal peptide synthetase n=1 Tax=Moorena sp. SIOASIH TaxID=2607817 RepID=UPI0013BA1CAD|nr:amino acid adenylation domain-containing protein [Moorena sp. SIOASIH]NEO41271.1 amino acid adenylation domain-containing protein [Moorena sp. SIOASIH]